MAHIPDLSDYNYLAEFARPGTRAVGWLDWEHSFQTALPDEGVPGTLWEYCNTSVAQTRGFHPCPFCKIKVGTEVKRDGKSLLLGTSEIRVFSNEGQVYAAPTLICHYVAEHHYRPPLEFVTALLTGLPPRESGTLRPTQGSQPWSGMIRQSEGKGSGTQMPTIPSWTIKRR